MPQQEYQKTLRQFYDDESLTFDQNLALSRRLVELNPNNDEGWYALASTIMFSLVSRPEVDELTEAEKSELRNNPLLDEMINAFEKVRIPERVKHFETAPVIN